MNVELAQPTLRVRTIKPSALRNPTASCALVSIHDLMPETITPVGELIEICRQHGLSKLTLLVVPGRNWQAADLSQLRAWVAQGHELAGHGWAHRCRSIRGWRHQLHSRLLSRDVAEHLALSGDEIVELWRACFDWFAAQNLTPPTLYVPPAWALGNVRADQLKRSPFPIIETTSGLLWTATGRRQQVPLVGFEADTVFRGLALGGWNRLVRSLASTSTRPLRIAIHPHDHRLRMRADLDRTLSLGFESISYRALWEPNR